MMFFSSIAARLPLATFSLGLLVHVEHQTGSYAAAGAVAGALAVAQGTGAPLLGRLVDRRGQTVVLLGSALTAGAALATVAALPAGTPLPVLILLAAVIGLATPPVGACLRTLIPVLVAPARQRKAYAVDAAATELTWVTGPPLALAVGSAAGTGTALTAAGGVLVAATALFALSPASRGWRPEQVTRPTRGSALAAPAMRTLIAVLTGVGVVFGATEVGVTATAESDAGLLLGLWGAGSLVGGVVAARLGGGAGAGRGFTLLLGLLGLGHLVLTGAAAAPIAFAVAITVAGSLIAPILASCYAMVDDIAPAGTVTEAFAWLATATAIGTSVGAAAGGFLADHAGPASAFVLAGFAGITAAAIATTLGRSPRYVVHPAR